MSIFIILPECHWKKLYFHLLKYSHSKIFSQRFLEPCLWFVYLILDPTLLKNWYWFHHISTGNNLSLKSWNSFLQKRVHTYLVTKHHNTWPTSTAPNFDMVLFGTKPLIVLLPMSIMYPWSSLLVTEAVIISPKPV